MNSFRTNAKKILFIVVGIGLLMGCLGGCKKAKTATQDTAQDTSDEPEAEQTYNPTPGYKRRLNKIIPRWMPLQIEKNSSLFILMLSTDPGICLTAAMISLSYWRSSIP